MAGELLVVASGKGGVGKTVTSVNLSVALRLQNKSVVVVDGDLGMPNVADLLGVDGGPTLHDALAGDAEPESVAVREASQFAVVPGDYELESFASADPSRFAYVTDRLAHQYDAVILDTGGGLSYESALPLELADDIILVTTPDHHAINDTKRTKALIDIVGSSVMGLVVTKATDATDPAAIAQEIDVDLLGSVPADPAVEESIQARSPLEVYAPDSGAAAAYRRLAGTVVDRLVASRDPVRP